MVTLLLKSNSAIKRILIAFLFVLLLAGVCCEAPVKSQINRSKSKPERSKSESSDKLPQVGENPEVYSVGPREADLFWRTADATPTYIRYGRDPKALATIRTNVSTKNHYVHIDDLSSDARYYYKTTETKDGGFKEFQTLPEPGGKLLFSFAVCTDIHLTNTKLDEFGSLYKESWAVFNGLIDELNGQPLDFLVVKGDVSDRSEAPDYQAFVEAAKRLQCKTYVVPGNHDKLRPSWGLFFNSFSPDSRSYYSIDHKNWHFVFLDSATEDNNTGLLGPDQLAWLQSDLGSHKDTPTMIFMHHLVRQTVFPKTDRFFIEDSPEFLKLLDDYAPAAVHSGHAHLNKATSYKDTDLIVTGAVITYPVQYNVYHVYEKGYVQTARRLQSFLDLAEASKDVMSTTYSVRFGLKPQFVPPLVEGTLQDRSFMRKIK